MKGVYTQIEKEELKEIIEEVLNINSAFVNIAAQTEEINNLRKAKYKLQRDFLIASEELDLEIEKIKSFLPEVKFSKENIHVAFEKPSLKIDKKTRKGKYQLELDSIRKRLEELRKK